MVIKMRKKEKTIFFVQRSFLFHQMEFFVPFHQQQYAFLVSRWFLGIVLDNLPLNYVVLFFVCFWVHFSLLNSHFFLEIRVLWVFFFSLISLTSFYSILIINFLTPVSYRELIKCQKNFSIFYVSFFTH